MLYPVDLSWAGFELTTLVVIGTDCIGSCKSNYQTITTTMAPYTLYVSGHFYRNQEFYVSVNQLNFCIIGKCLVSFSSKHIYCILLINLSERLLLLSCHLILENNQFVILLIRKGHVVSLLQILTSEWGIMGTPFWIWMESDQVSKHFYTIPKLFMYLVVICPDLCLFVCLMVFNATFNNISVLVEETGGPGENHRPVASHWQALSHNVLHLTLIKIQIHNISGDSHCLHR